MNPYHIRIAGQHWTIAKPLAPEVQVIRGFQATPDQSNQHGWQE
jgi:hypothetical protein